MTRLLIFHPTVAPYRVDFFNDLNASFRTQVCLKYWNLRDQSFDYQKIYDRFSFRPVYLKELFHVWGRSVYGGYWNQLNLVQPDLVLTDEFGMSTAEVLLHRFLKRKHYRVVTLCDDSHDMVANKHEFSWLHRMARRLMAPHVDEIIVVAPEVEAWYREHFGKGFCFSILQEDEAFRKRLRKLLGRSRELQERYRLEGKKVFLFVGRLVALKNVKTLIRAFAHLRQKENVLVIVGDGPEMGSLMHLAESMNLSVRFTGRLEGDALQVWYNLADVFVLPSLQEAFGAVVNEALLAGCYALVSERAGASCLIQEGVNGFTFDPMEDQELVALMNEIRILPAQYGEDGLKVNRMLYSYRECMKRLVNHLQGMTHE